MKKTVGCGDWHLGWGFGGNDHLGKLSTEDNVNFTWTGHRQGRHGQKLRGKYTVTFTYTNEVITVTSDISDLPDRGEVKKAINELINK